MPRIARVCAVNYPHHVTQRGNNREPVFFDDERIIQGRKKYVMPEGLYRAAMVLKPGKHCGNDYLEDAADIVAESTGDIHDKFK